MIVPITREDAMSLRAICFVDMPFGKKPDLGSGVTVDFDQIYETGIKPAIVDAHLEPVRGDQERTGGIIHVPMFGRLLLSDFVIADLTLSNPNVFYELGIRHTARPFTTVPIFAAIHPIPFDVALVRAIPYTLVEGRLTDETAAALKAALGTRLTEAIRGAATQDSPIYQLIPSFPQVYLPHEITEIFQDEVRHSDEFRKLLSDARAKASDKERMAALREIRDGLGDLHAVQSAALVDLMLSFRDVSAWDDMVKLTNEFPDGLKANVMVRQQRALALNRRNQPGDREEAQAILEKLVKEKGADPETLGILGRVHKDRYAELNKAGDLMASAALDEAIEAYTKGFESDPRDYYPGVNAVNLLVQKGDADALKEAARLVPLVSFAVARRGGASSSDYWDLATVLELSAIGGDWALATRVLPKVLNAGKASWMIDTTMKNLNLLKAAREREGQALGQLDQMLGHLQKRYQQLQGEEAEKAKG
jgi:tetratricopeptide (TPR) repeat protein